MSATQTNLHARSKHQPPARVHGRKRQPAQAEPSPPGRTPALYYLSFLAVLLSRH